jgi:hypothetical protein
MGSFTSTEFRFGFVTWLAATARSKENVSVGMRCIVGAYSPWSARMFSPMMVCHSMSAGTRRTAWSSKA